MLAAERRLGQLLGALGAGGLFSAAIGLSMSGAGGAASKLPSLGKWSIFISTPHARRRLPTWAS